MTKRYVCPSVQRILTGAHLHEYDLHTSLMLSEQAVLSGISQAITSVLGTDLLHRFGKSCAVNGPKNDRQQIAGVQNRHDSLCRRDYERHPIIRKTGLSMTKVAGGQ